MIDWNLVIDNLINAVERGEDENPSFLVEFDRRGVSVAIEVFQQGRDFFEEENDEVSGLGGSGPE